MSENGTVNITPQPQRLDFPANRQNFQGEQPQRLDFPAIRQNFRGDKPGISIRDASLINKYSFPVFEMDEKNS